MAIQFNPNALSMFSGVNFGNDNAIANLGGDDKLVQKDKLGLFLWKPFRSGDTEKRNNAVRTELLKALAQAFGLEGVTEHDGKTMFSDEFMNRLSDLLGSAFKRGDFGIKDGIVASGKPLTQRRITAIFKAAATVKAETPYDAKTYLAKVDSLEDVLKTKDPNAQTTITGLDYAQSFKLTIAFIENDLPGFDRECKNIDDLEEIVRFVGRKTKIAFYAEEIAAFLNQANPAAHDDNPVADMQEKRAIIKTYFRNRLEAYVKNSVDICLEAMRAGKLEDCMEVLFKTYFGLQYIERDLEQFRKTNLAEDVH